MLHLQNSISLLDQHAIEYSLFVFVFFCMAFDVVLAVDKKLTHFPMTGLILLFGLFAILVSL